MEKKQSDKVTFLCKIQARNKNESSFFPGYHYHFYSWIQNNLQFYFQKLTLAGALAS